MHKNGMIGLLWITFLIIAMFALLAIAITQAYSYNDYDDRDEENINELDDDDDAVGYYDYAGQWHEIPEPDPYCPAVSYGHHHGRSPISTMMPLFIFFFVFLLWLAYALGCDED